MVRTAGRKKTHGLVLASCVPPDQVLAWTGVERRLLSLGVYADLAGELLAGAAQRGATPEDVSALADHFESKPGAWTAGALTIAVKRWSAGTSTSPAQAYDAAALWPPPSDAYQKSRAREAAGRLRDATASEERNRQARLNQERQAALARESRLGPQLDALGEDELAALIAATPRAQLEVFSKARKERPLKGQLRDVLLVALSQQQQPQTQENFQ